MIKDEQEYEATQSWVRNFEHSLSALDRRPEHGRGPLDDVHRDALRSQLETLRGEAAEYERLVSGSATDVPCDLEDLPGTLVRRRIAMGMSERDVAERLGLEERQVVEYERTGYEGASHGAMLRALSVLSAGGDEDILRWASADFEAAVGRLSRVGLDRKFLNEHVLHDPDEAEGGALQERSKPRMLARLGALFGWTSREVLGGGGPPAFGPAARGVRCVGADPGRLHVAYAKSMAGILGRASRRCWALRGPSILDALRRSMMERPGPPSFAQILECAWKSGIPVMRLASLAFRSACLRGDGGGPAVVVLSGDRTSEMGLMLDLLRGVHCAGEGGELVHAGRAPGGARGDPADEFAYDVLLRGNADGLFRGCLALCAERGTTGARNGLPALVEAAVDAAERGGVRPDSLACYVIHRLAGGMAPSRHPAPTQGLQKHVEGWPAVVSDAVLARADFSAIDRTEQALLVGAVQAGYARKLPVLPAARGRA